MLKGAREPVQYDDYCLIFGYFLLAGYYVLFIYPRPHALEQD